MSKRLLLVDDDVVLLKSLEGFLSGCTDLFETDICFSVDDAVYLSKIEKYDLIITDINMPEKTGIDLMLNLKQNMFQGTIMVMTAYGDREVFKKIRKLGGMNIIVKPIDLQWMKEMLVAFFEEKQVFLETLDAIDLNSILQVINLEKKTITIKIEMNGNYGFLYFEDGELINSEYDRLTGEEAAVKLITSNKGKFSLIKTQKRIERKIEVPFIHFLVNIMKDIDHDRIRRKWRSTWNGKIEKKTGIQIDEAIFKDLKITSGFKGAGIYSKDGNLIIEENLDLINIEELGLLGLDLYESAVHKIQRNQLGKLELLHIQTDKMILVFSWLVFREIFIAVIIDIEGNLGIVKHRIKNISQSIDDYIIS